MEKEGIHILFHFSFAYHNSLREKLPMKISRQVPNLDLDQTRDLFRLHLPSHNFGYTPSWEKLL